MKDLFRGLDFFDVAFWVAMVVCPAVVGTVWGVVAAIKWGFSGIV